MITIYALFFTVIQYFGQVYKLRDSRDFVLSRCHSRFPLCYVGNGDNSCVCGILVPKLIIIAKCIKFFSEIWGSNNFII